MGGYFHLSPDGDWVVIQQTGAVLETAKLADHIVGPEPPGLNGGGPGGPGEPAAIGPGAGPMGPGRAPPPILPVPGGRPAAGAADAVPAGDAGHGADAGPRRRPRGAARAGGGLRRAVADRCRSPATAAADAPTV